MQDKGNLPRKTNLGILRGIDKIAGRKQPFHGKKIDKKRRKLIEDILQGHFEK